MADRLAASGALVVLLVLLTACTDSAEQAPAAPASAAPRATASAGEPADVPPPEAPRVGVCRRLDLAAATRLNNAGRTVSCRQPHTARTIFVGRARLRASSERLAPDSARMQRRLRDACTARQRAYLGGTVKARRLSRFAVVWFTPTLEEVERGADWFRCDLVALGDSERLLRLPSGVRGALDRPRTLERYGLCGTASPGSRGFERVACALRHRWIAIGTRTLDGGRRYPGVRRVRSAGRSCVALVRSGDEEVRRFDYGWEWPTAAQWRDGQRYGICWAPEKLA